MPFSCAFPMSYAYTPERIPDRLPFEIRDPDDIAVLYSAVIAEADVLITGDKDFAEISIEKPEILTPSEFMAKYH